MSAPKNKLKLAAELVSKGATMMAEPCPLDGGIQVRYRGKVYCTVHDDLSSIAMATTVSFDTVVAQTREVLLNRLNEAATKLGAEKDGAKQDELVSLMTKYFELLQKLPQK
ncbi:MAG TPA: Sjogren's syndrome/scleroderma autoantigen 1 family protein [Nitrososphaerales archaeon]|nr:Sjogren's syndrome/scleroderma autoantigen 1 family protein [Nitrososphaerales archaeon]